MVDDQIDEFDAFLWLEEEYLKGDDRILSSEGHVVGMLYDYRIDFKKSSVLRPWCFLG